VSWVWVVLLVLAVGVILAAEWPLFDDRFGGEARRQRDRAKRKAELHVISNEDDDFVKSVQRDLDALPTTEEPRSKR